MSGDGRSTLDTTGDPLDHLASLLAELDIDPDTQTLVFSKTSFQKALISPGQPRAVYFNDDTVVAYVPDRDDVAAVAAVLKRHFDAARPANTTVCAPLAVPGAKVELEVTAIRGSRPANPP